MCRELTENVFSLRSEPTISLFMNLIPSSYFHTINLDSHGSLGPPIYSEHIRHIEHEGRDAIALGEIL